MSTLARHFGKAVRSRREKLGISQEEFADQAEIHRTYVSSIELGKVTVSIEVAAKLGKALGVPLSRLFKDVEEEQQR